MNKLLIASAAVLALSAGAASAADLGKGLSWNTELTTTYNVTDDEVVSELETGLAYAISADFSAYGTAYVDVKETTFTGTEFGVAYEPEQLKYVSGSAYVTLDENFENEKFFVEAVLKF